MILNAIRPVVWKKGWKRLAILDVDIFSAGLNFVFGQADLSGATSVISLVRLENEFYGLAADERLLVERAVKEAVHEIGHTLGVVHCKSRECVMYFSNSLVDTDRKGSAYCAQCMGRLAPKEKR
jgi:archaemetzincin